MSAPSATSSEQTIQPLNLGERGGQTVFDAAMPGGSYSDLALKVTGSDFIATVSVNGSQQQTGPVTKIGDYTIFDLTRQRLGRSTVLHLPVSDFRYLHFRITGQLRPENVSGLSVAQLPAGQLAYTVIAESSQVTQKDRASTIEFTVPAHVPVDRVVFVAGATPANFSRDVTIEARPIVQTPAGDSTEPPATGFFERQSPARPHYPGRSSHRPGAFGHRCAASQFRSAVQVDRRRSIMATTRLLIPASVRLEMVKRNVCFEASGDGYMLYYGDSKLSPPRYDLGQFLVVRPADAAQAIAGPEQPNPDLSSPTRRSPVHRKAPAAFMDRTGDGRCSSRRNCPAHRKINQAAPGLTLRQSWLAEQSSRRNRNSRVARKTLIRNLVIRHQFPRGCFAQRIVQRRARNRFQMPPERFRIGTVLENKIDRAFAHRGKKHRAVFDRIARLARDLVCSLVAVDSESNRQVERHLVSVGPLPVERDITAGLA